MKSIRKEKDLSALGPAEWDQVLSDIIFEHSNALLSRILRMVKSRFDAEEILQDIFVAAWNSQKSFHEKKDVLAFLSARAYFRSLDFLRKVKFSSAQVEEITEACADLHTNAETLYEAEEITLQILLIVDNMPEQRKKVFTMSRIDGLSREEISKKLDIAMQTVSNHLTVALSELKKVLLFMVVIFFAIEP